MPDSMIEIKRSAALDGPLADRFLEMYNASFPAEERVPFAEIQRSIAAGQRTLFSCLREAFPPLSAFVVSFPKSPPLCTATFG